MSAPKRFSASNGLEGQLLRSARADARPVGARRRAVLAAAAAAAAGTKAATATAALTTLARVAVWKWVAVGAVGVSTIVAARAVVQRPIGATHAAAAPAACATTARAPRASAGARSIEGLAIPPPVPLPAVAPRLDPAMPPHPSRVKTAPAPRPASSEAPVPAIDATSAPRPPLSTNSRLADEIAAIDHAKQALKGGDPAQALVALDAYSGAFPRGVLDAEASALRVEALVQAGRRDEARAQLAELRRRHPGSPLLENLGDRVGE